MRATPARISPETYPIAATATATALVLDVAPEAEVASHSNPATGEAQPMLFSAPQEPRVIPFDSLVSSRQRESIRSRSADVQGRYENRPEPVRSTKVEVSPRKAKTARSSRKQREDNQQNLDFLAQSEVALPLSSIICDAPVAPPSQRTHAGIIDGVMMALGLGIFLAAYWLAGGSFAIDKHNVVFFVLAAATVIFAYKFFWLAMGKDSIGMSSARLRLVDFDGNLPGLEKRIFRLFGSFLSLFAAGLGLLWVFADEDQLTWHDHISGTFPTPVIDE